MLDSKDLLKGLVEELLLGTDYFIVEVHVSGSNKVMVFLDGDNGIEVELCAKISRKIRSYLDDSNILGENYSIEVSSPGLDIPLIMRRQYKKNIGRNVRVVLKEGYELLGVLEEVNESNIVIDEIEKKLINNKNLKIISLGKKEISFKDISSTKVLAVL
ncbi:MAG: hypothetical protein IIA45_15410 [Bacteroidetes bacterium]|nr:hypothetical protein [Bacteroidota bacterium]